MQKQMSPVVGVPKREPCQKCGNPVFLAERLSVGRALYHRTCLRCARCDSQLTLGSFYETEMDGVFCCETCPDEDTLTKRNEQTNIASSSSGQDMVDDYLQMDPTRKSFSEKLAMFQTNDKGLLQKSLSDEEKSKSLQRLSEMYARNVATNNKDVSNETQTKSDAVIETPSNTDANGDDENDSESSSDTESEHSDPHESIESSQAPPIPTKPPPIASKAKVLSKIYGSAATPSPVKSTPRNGSIYEIDPQQVHHSTTEFAKGMLTANRDEEEIEEVEGDDEKSQASQTQPSIANRSNLADNNDSKISPAHSIAENDSHAIDDSNPMPSNHHQQETIPNVTKDDQTANCNESIGVSEAANDDAIVTEIAPVDDTEIANQLVDVANASSESHLETNAQAESKVREPSGDQAAAANDQIEITISASAENEQNATEQDDAIVLTPSKPVPVKRAIVPAETNAGDLQPPTPMRRKNISNTFPDEDSGLSASIESNSTESNQRSLTPTDQIASSSSPAKSKQYPVQLNPFGDSDDDEAEQEVVIRGATAKPALRTPMKSNKLDNSNPFDSSDDEIELLKDTPQKATERKSSAVRMSTNPFGSDSEDEVEHGASSKRTPVPTPRKLLNVSMPSRNSTMYGSVSSLTSTTPRHKKGRAPPAPIGAATIESRSSSLQHSAASSPSHSNRATPMLRKKRPAPLPPTKSLQPNELSTSMLHMTSRAPLNHSFGSCSTLALDDSMHLDSSLQSNESTSAGPQYFTTNSSLPSTEQSQRKLIPIDASLLEDMPSKSLPDIGGEENVCYRRTIVPTEMADAATTADEQQHINDRQWEKMKENKESQNKNRQSQTVVLSPAEDTELPYGSNKSSYGKWKRRKGPAPSLPIPPRKVLQMLPLEDIRHELEVIEVQQQGLEKQGVQLEKMIRERCEGGDNEMRPLDEFKPNSKEVEDLILQLFELVNEKNELFRRQAELMYLRRQHRLEQEQADIEYEIRVLMAQPECNKTDSDKSREETLITRLLEVVQLRNEVIESLEMDRRREAEEDQSIKERMEMHTAQRDKKLTQPRATKLSKKEKKKQKESKKLAKLKKVDADKDADESEAKLERGKEEKKKKKKFLLI